MAARDGPYKINKVFNSMKKIRNDKEVILCEEKCSYISIEPCVDWKPLEISQFNFTYPIHGGKNKREAEGIDEA